MKNNRYIRVLLGLVIVVVACQMPEAPLALAKRVLEALVVVHLSYEVLTR